MTEVGLTAVLDQEFERLAEALSRGEPFPFPERLGVRYEALNQGSLARRQAGAHYTPAQMTGPIVHATLEPLLRHRDASALLQLRVIDPAMGAGAFLAEACRTVATRLLELGGAETLIEARRRVAECCIHGVDLDPVAVTLARRVLWLVVGDAQLPLDFLNSNLRHGDALVGEGRAVEPAQNFPSEPFHWHRAFPQVFAAGGFDALLGNPPFRNAVEARVASASAQKEWWRVRWPRFSAGASDRSLLFWARGTRDLLAPGGRYGMLSPTALLSAGGTWQAWMFENWRPDHLWLEPVDRFDGARVRTTAIIGGQGRAKELELRDREFGSEGVPWSRSWPDSSPRWYSLTRSVPIELEPGSWMPLSEVVTVRAGCSTGAAYELRDHVRDQASGLAPRLVSTGAIDRYRLHWGRRQRFLGTDYDHPRWPCGDEAPASVCRARDVQAGPKILIGGLTRVLEAWLDLEGDTAGIVSTWVLQVKDADPAWLRALLVVLNSATASRLYRQDHGGASMSGRQVTIKKKALLSLQIPCALQDPGVRKGLARCANRLLSGSNESHNRTEDRAAHLQVADLYGRSLHEQNADLEWWMETGGFD